MSVESLIDVGNLNDIRSSELFGGILDLIEADQNFALAVDHIKVSALLFRTIVIQDSWFLAYGPIVDHLQSLGDDDERWANDDFVKLVEKGVIQIASREGRSLAENWDNGENVGITPGEFLTVRKDEGNRFVYRISERAERAKSYVAFPKPLVSKNKSLFGLAVERYLKQFEYPNDENDELSYLRSPVRATRAFVDDFKEFVEREMSANFRRGQVEQFVAEQIGLDRFSYRSLRREAMLCIENQALPLTSAIAFEFMHDISTIYSGTQSQLFKVRPQAHYGHDPQLLENYLRGVELATREVMPNCVLDLRDALEARSLRADDVIAIREKLGDGAYFQSTLDHMSRCANSADEMAFIDLAAFLRNDYVPAIINKFPSVRVMPRANRVALGMHTLAESTESAKKYIEGTGVLLGVIGSAGYAASLVGYSDLDTYIRLFKENVVHNTPLHEAAAIFWGLGGAFNRVERFVKSTAETADARLKQILIKRAQRRVDSWAHSKRNNYLTVPTST